MKRLVLIFIMFISSSSFADDNLFETVSGNLDVNLLEMHLSKYFEADISDTQLSIAYNPGALVSNLLSTYYHDYILKFTINENHSITCDITLILKREEIMINSCYSDTAKVQHVGFIQYKEVGLPQKVKFN